MDESMQDKQLQDLLGTTTSHVDSIHPRNWRHLVERIADGRWIRGCNRTFADFFRDDLLLKRVGRGLVKWSVEGLGMQSYAYEIAAHRNDFLFAATDNFPVGHATLVVVRVELPAATVMYATSEEVEKFDRATVLDTMRGMVKYGFPREINELWERAQYLTLRQKELQQILDRICR